VLLPTTLVGSYPQPDWLIDRALLASNTPPRVRMRQLWRVAPEHLEQAQDDATILAIRDQERAGIDIVTDGEVRRESYFNRFATALDGIDLDNPGTIISRSGKPAIVPRVVGRIRRVRPVERRDAEFLRAQTDRRVKVTVPGPFTMTQLAKDDYYGSNADLALDYAAAVNEEVRDLFSAGVDVVQLDEPYLQAQPDAAREYGLPALERALEGVRGTTALHICFGYGVMVTGKPGRYAFLPELAGTRLDQISIEAAQPSLDCSVLTELSGKTVILGVLDLSTPEVESTDVVAARIRRALPYVAPERLIVAPDCGLKYLPRSAAFGKLQAMVAGARLVREELASTHVLEDV
jgi:5-methyltetrahydropteroyltriglutamate--homocysteine methyltransferase